MKKISIFSAKIIELLKNQKSETTISSVLFFPLLFLFCLTFELNAQSLDVPYVPTPDNVVEKMLDMVDVGPGDYVIDLGSGDGRIVIAAAKRGAYGHGVDLDPKRIREARENAVRAGVEDRVIFVEGNIFNTDFSRANVVTMYLLNSVNIQLRPHLLKNLKPGSRIVSHDFDMGNWKPEEYVQEGHSDIYFWLIPADVHGKWNWKAGGKSFSMSANQEFQEITLQLKSGNSSLAVENSKLLGDRISFTASNPSGGEKYVYSGRVEGNKIIGAVQIRTGNNSSIENWSATLD